MISQEDFLTEIADAIREKEGSTDPIRADNFADRIAAISTGTDTSDATATASDILSGVTAYGADGLLTGTIESKSSSDLTVSENVVTVPAGYYASSATGTVPTVTAAIPSISVSSAGVITATTSQSAGYVASTSNSTTKSLTTQAAKTVTPSTSSQTAVASGRYTTGAVTVAGDSNLTAANIASGVSIFGVTGTHEGSSNLYATTKTNLSASTLSITGLSFTPTGIAVASTDVISTSNTGFDYYDYIVDSVWYKASDSYTVRIMKSTGRVNIGVPTVTFGASSVSLTATFDGALTASYFYGDYEVYVW